MNLPLALTLMRVAEGLTQEDLAKALNVSKSHICEIEKGKKMPSLDLVEGYTQHFKFKYQPFFSLLKDLWLITCVFLIHL